MKFEGVDIEFDLDPLEPFIRDERVTEIMVNGMSGVYVEKEGELILTDATFDDEEHILRAINSIVEPMGRWVNEQSPLVDARLPDGSRINATVRMSRGGEAEAACGQLRARLEADDAGGSENHA